MSLNNILLKKFLLSVPRIHFVLAV